MNYSVKVNPLCATKVEVELEFYDGEASITVTDDGIGFKVPKRLSDFVTSSKLGILGMQERVCLLNGRLYKNSKPSAGTTIRVKIFDFDKTEAKDY